MKLNHSINLHKVVLIDGLTRCGKSSLCQMIVSLKKSEHVDMLESLETILSGVVLKKVTNEFAKSYMISLLNQLCYHKLLSRGVNFRPTDFSGIQNYREPKIYFNRLKLLSSGKKKYHYKKTHIKINNDDDKINKILKEKKLFFPFQTHLILCDYEKFLKLKLDYKLIEIFRSPVDNTVSLINRDVFKKNNVIQNPRRVDLDIFFQNKSIPWFTHNYAKKFVKANIYEKSALFVIEQIQKIKNKKKIITPQINKNIIIVKYEELITSTKSELRRISSFLKTSLTSKTDKFIKAANCPRKINKDIKNKNIIFLKSKIKDKKILKRLLDLENSYQKNLYGFKD